MDQTFKSPKQPHPRETANLLSLVTFFYNFDLFKKGFKKELEDDDIYDVLTSCKSKTLGDQLEKQWETDKKRYKKPSLVRVLWSCFGKTYLMFGVIQLIMRTVLVLAVPEAMGKLVSFFSPHQTKVTRQDAYYYAAIVIALNVINFVYTQNYLISLTEFGIRMRTAICSFLYRKSLQMAQSSLSEISIGKIVTLITKDVHSIEMVILFGNDIWIGIIQTVIVCYLIYGKIGYATFSGVGFFLLILPLQLVIGKMSTHFRLKSSKKTDERLCLTQEILTRIKTIKMYVWETFYFNRLSIFRRKEVNAIFKLFCLKIVIIVIGSLSAKIAFYLLIMTYVWMGNYLTAETVYFIKSCFHKLTHLLSILLPLGVTFGAEFNATLIRLKSVLRCQEVTTPHNYMTITNNEPTIILNKVSVKINNFEIIQNATFEIKQGLNIVVGHMGSGRTSLLKTILEDNKIEGNLTVYGVLSYASQEPWLFPSTIRNNILFGAKMDYERYKQVLEVCALNYDLKNFADADNTLVGDNGVNLSKGQQARVNLARAIYRTADIYLLDDCLAALDAHVSDYIFKKCLIDFLKNKLCIFVSNSSHYMRCSDWIISLENSKIEYKANVNKVAFKILNNREDEFVKSNYDIGVVEKKLEDKKVYKEEKKSGKVELSTYNKYIKYGGGYIVFAIIVLGFVIVQTAVSYSDKLVSSWVTIEQDLSTHIALNLTNSTEFASTKEERSRLLNLYTIMIVSATALSLIKAMCFFGFTRTASINLHKEMISKILNAKLTFFDKHFIGNVLNRFAKDLCMIDEHLPYLMEECVDKLFVLAGIIILVATVNAIFLIPTAVFFVVAYVARFVYLRTGRSLQRLEASTRSPLIGHLNASLEGLITIRAFKAQQIIKDEFDKHQDLYTSVNYTMHNSVRALSFVLDGMCSLFISIVILKFLIFTDDTTVGNVGLAITQSFHLSGLLQYSIRRWADFENQMTSVERVLQYMSAEQEKRTGKVLEDWPQKGKIRYESVSLTYKDRQVLTSITFDIKPGEKIGIVGRTGAGKSSIISSLFRLYDIEGVIKIDDEDIQDLQLEYLRSSIAIIPQDPVLVSGTIRENIDPLGKYKDEEIWKTLKIVKLQDKIPNLTDKIENNNSFSAGQKQLICLARAIIRTNKIVVLDEATANLDNDTDSAIREVISENFALSTVIIITHRLASIMTTDVVMVVDDGQIVEQGPPSVLLEDENSLFFAMIKQT